ncbi:MAG TPA: disulfide bond formation protein B [Candidatus Paceibacterota bacterium]
MTALVENLNFLFALGTICLQLSAGILLILYFSKQEHAGKHFLRAYGLHLALLLSLVTTIGTLLYSEVLGFEPCSLCWLQRVFLYPQIILLGVALIKKEYIIADYCIGLSIPGALIALYQHYLQMGGSAFVRCPAVSDGVDCAKRILFEFGYITFPLMSFTIFIVLIILMLFVRKRDRTL